MVEWNRIIQINDVGKELIVAVIKTEAEERLAEKEEEIANLKHQLSEALKMIGSG